MNETLRLIVAILALLLVGGIATVYFRAIVMRRDETQAGIRAMSATSWRDFIHLVLDALGQRGYQRLFDRAAPTGDNEYTLERDGKRYLLSCKHGGAFVLGIATVNELANEIRLTGATGGILVTQGRIAADTYKPAALLKIELLDGATLWPELRDLLPAEQLGDIRTTAAAQARRRVLLSWLLALLVGVITYSLLPGRDDDASTKRASQATENAIPGSGTSATESAESGDKTPAALSSRGTVPAPADGDTAGADRQRKEVADAVSALPTVERAIWSTPSTLQVFLREGNGNDAVIEHVCPILVRYDALSSSRLQLSPPSGSNLPTRFRQCRSY